MNYLITQNNMLTAIIRWYFKLTKTNPNDMPMVSYWRTKSGVSAKITKGETGNIYMTMEGEKHPFPSFPRGHVLFNQVSKIKHEVKNQVLNESWRKLEEGVPNAEIIKDIKHVVLDVIPEISEKSRFDMIRPSSMTPATREIHRAWTKVSPETGKVRDYLCFVLQEDDSYRFRFQWMYQWFGWLWRLNPIKSFDYALKMLEHGEVIGDMKERMRLFRRVVMLALSDPSIQKKFIALMKEINWKKVTLSPGDKYHFRGKYFKVDLKYIEY